MTCKKAQGFLEKNAVQAENVVDAGKQKHGRGEALALARSAGKVVVAKGKNVVTLDMKKDAPNDDTLAGYLLGPTGNLRAPTIRQGKTLYVGFSEQAYQQLLG